MTILSISIRASTLISIRRHESTSGMFKSTYILCTRVGRNSRLIISMRRRNIVKSEHTYKSSMRRRLLILIFILLLIKS